MSDMPRKIHIEQHSGLGLVWLIGWLFSIGYAKLNFWGGLAGIFVWPFYLGDHMASAAALPPPG
ncbi:MAG TPA: hypothetical protein PLH23_13930 [Hyphomonadaceae bacterium]|nr:hypothetical protein [Hyphomonadaceae bacterium]HPI49367.1 hypothetical protein [Hyphomonadaceae bacterium]